MDDPISHPQQGNSIQLKTMSKMSAEAEASEKKLLIGPQRGEIFCGNEPEIKLRINLFRDDNKKITENEK